MGRISWCVDVPFGAFVVDGERGKGASVAASGSKRRSNVRWRRWKQEGDRRLKLPPDYEKYLHGCCQMCSNVL